MEKLITLGILFIFVGMLFVIIGSLATQSSNSKVVVGGFIGFISFGFANDRKMLYVVMGLSALFFSISCKNSSNISVILTIHTPNFS